MSENLSKLKVPSDEPKKRFWLFDFDGVAVNLQIPLVYTACTARGHSQMTSAERGREGVAQILTQ